MEEHTTTLGNTISQYRKSLGLTQDTLAQRLGVTNQAVSKWESDQCCPDVTLLPKIADIFAIPIDALFSREVPAAGNPEPEDRKSGFEKMGHPEKQEQWQEEPTWPDDNVLRVVMFVDRKIVASGPARNGLAYRYEGSVDGVLSPVSISCGDVSGNVEAGGNVSCGNVGGNADAGCSVHCGNVKGSVDAGTDVRCGDVGGDVDAGCIVECGSVAGDIDANGPVTIRR